MQTVYFFHPKVLFLSGIWVNILSDKMNNKKHPAEQFQYLIEKS
jgi:hypothetical protein